MIVNIPITSSAGPNPHPATVDRWSYSTRSGTSAIAVHASAIIPCTRKSARYCIDVISDVRADTAKSRR